MLRYFSGFRADRRGTAAILFALVVLPLVGVAGAAVDYSRATRTKAELQSYVDKAALAGAQALARTPGAYDAAEATAVAALGGLSGTSVARELQHEITFAGTQVSVCVTGRIHTTMTAVLGIGNMDIANCASASAPRGRHLEIHLALDLSASMGMAAESNGRDRMQALWGCTFACHRPRSWVTPEMAHDAGIPLRIDVLREASRDFAVAMLAENEVVDVQFGIHAIHDTARVMLAAPSDDAPSIMQALDGIALSGRSTRFDRALPIIDAAMGEQGSGVDRLSPRKMMLLITDGILSDESWDMPHEGTRPLDPRLCEAIKSRGIPVAVLYLQYVPMANHARSQRTVATFIDDIPTELRACASPSLFFEANDPDEIAAALFSFGAGASDGGVRLTR